MANVVEKKVFKLSQTRLKYRLTKDNVKKLISEKVNLTEKVCKQLVDKKTKQIVLTTHDAKTAFVMYHVLYKMGEVSPLCSYDDQIISFNPLLKEHMLHMSKDYYINEVLTAWQIEYVKWHKKIIGTDSDTLFKRLGKTLIGEKKKEIGPYGIDVYDADPLPDVVPKQENSVDKAPIAVAAHSCIDETQQAVNVFNKTHGFNHTIFCSEFIAFPDKTQFFGVSAAQISALSLDAVRKKMDCEVLFSAGSITLPVAAKSSKIVSK